MAKQIYYEDIKIGDDIPTLVKHPVPRQLVMWAGVSGDFYEIHYDKDFAVSCGLPSIIVHGQLTASFLAQMLTDWMGEMGTFRRLTTTNRAMLFPNQDVVCKGKVTGKTVEGGEHYVECELWAENPRGEKCVTATAKVALPAR